MQSGKGRVRAAVGGLVMLLALLVLLGGWQGTAAAETAQEVADGGLFSIGIGARTEGLEYPGYTFGARFIVTTESGEYIGECTLEYADTSVPWYNCRVDVPSDRISLVRQDPDSIPAGYAPVENPIAFDPTTYETGPHNIGAVFLNVPVETSTTTTSTVIITTMENGQLVYDTCYVLVDFSDVACHEDGNGYVFFPSVPVGTYTVRQVADLGPNRHVDDFTIEVTGIDDPAAPYPGMEMFSTEIISTSGASSGSGSPGTVAGTEPAGPSDLLSLLPSLADVPAGLVETGRRTRPLPEVAGNYTDPAETTRLFTGWEWQGNAIASFALPSTQQAQSGEVNGVYVSIHRFGDADAARAALDFSLVEQAAGTDLQEITTGPLGEHTRSLYGVMDYGNETTVLVQQGGVFIRVSVAMLDGDPTADAVAVTDAILLNVTADSTTDATTEQAIPDSLIAYSHVGCMPADVCLNATITVTSEDGAFIASATCPDTTMIAPWTCSPRDVPRGIPVVITIDGIAPGWTVEQHPLYWDTTAVPSPGPGPDSDGMPIFKFVQAADG